MKFQISYSNKSGTRQVFIFPTMGIVSKKKQWYVDFYYMGKSDSEWKRGAHGLSVDLCDTLEQARRKARYYIKKES